MIKNIIEIFKRINKYVVILSIIFIIVVYIIIDSCVNKSEYKNKKTDTISQESIKVNVEKYFVNKLHDYETYFLNNAIYIGNSKKEIENEYFDIKIDCTNFFDENKLTLCINKLSKKYITNAQDTLIDVAFLDNLVNCVNDTFTYNLNLNEIQQVTQYIKENYINLRKTHLDEEKNVSNIMQNKINMISKIKLKSYIDNNMLVVEILKV